MLLQLAVGATKKVLAFWAAEHLEMRLAWKLTKGEGVPSRYVNALSSIVPFID